LRTLLTERFKLTAHYEDQPVQAYTMTSAKPKLASADPAGRTSYHERPGADGKDPRIGNPAITRLVTCLNMTMAQFAGNLPQIASSLKEAFTIK
jgi:uncharacterized protein (TIGR03435 family)